MKHSTFKALVLAIKYDNGNQYKTMFDWYTKYYFMKPFIPPLHYAQSIAEVMLDSMVEYDLIKHKDYKKIIFRLGTEATNTSSRLFSNSFSDLDETKRYEYWPHLIAELTSIIRCTSIYDFPDGFFEE